MLVITEYCSLGDLLNFLRQKAETFVNLVMNIPEIMENSHDYKNICNQKWYIRRSVKRNPQWNVAIFCQHLMVYLAFVVFFFFFFTLQ